MVSGVFCIPLDAEPVVSRNTPAAGSPLLAMRQYVGGAENRLVQTAVQTLEQRDPRFSPLVLYGPTGTGKTLLARGLAAQWRQRNPHDTVVVTTGSDFARAYGNAVASNGLAEFRRKLQAADLLVLEDVLHIQRKSGAQDELSHTLDSMCEQASMVLVTARTTPADSRQLAARLRSRLTAGLLVPLTVPGPSARQLLLQQLIELHELTLPTEAYHCFASGVRDARLSVPELNHLVVQLHHVAQTTDHPLDAPTVRAYLTDQLGIRRPTISSIAQSASQHFAVPVADLRGPSRHRGIVRARGVAMYLAWELTGKSLDAIGKYFGNRDHTTVLHACRRTKTARDSDPAVQQAVQQLTQQLTGR